MSPFIEALLVEIFKVHFDHESIRSYVMLYGEDPKEAEGYFFDIWQAFKFDCLEKNVLFDEVEILALFENNGVPFKKIWEPIILRDADIQQFAVWKNLNERQYFYSTQEKTETNEEVESKHKSKEKLRKMIYNYFSEVSCISLAQISRMEMQFDLQLKKLIVDMEEKNIPSDVTYIKETIRNAFRGLPEFLLRSVDRYENRLMNIKPKKVVKKIIKAKVEKPSSSVKPPIAEYPTVKEPDLELPPPIETIKSEPAEATEAIVSEIEPLADGYSEEIESYQGEITPILPPKEIEVRQIKLQEPTDPSKPDTAEKKVEITKITISEESIKSLVEEQMPLFTDIKSFYWKIRELIANMRKECTSDDMRIKMLLTLFTLEKTYKEACKAHKDKKSLDFKKLQNIEYALHFHVGELGNAIPPDRVAAAKLIQR